MAQPKRRGGKTDDEAGAEQSRQMAYLRRQLRQQQQQMAKLQEIMLQNQRLFMAQQQQQQQQQQQPLAPGALPPPDAGSFPPYQRARGKPPNGLDSRPQPAVSKTVRWDAAATQQPVAAAARGEMAQEARYALKECLEKLSSAKLKGALTGVSITGGELDLNELDSSTLWRLHDYCAAASAARRPRGSTKRAGPSTADIESAAVETERQLIGVRAARAALDNIQSETGTGGSSSWTDDCTWASAASESDSFAGGDTADDGDALLGQLDDDGEWNSF